MMTVTVLDPDYVRARVLADHMELRWLLKKVERHARRAAADPRETLRLRESAGELYRRLAAHLNFEDRLLAPALRDVVGWGDALSERLSVEHRRQRARLEKAMVLAREEKTPAADLLESVRSFGRDLDREMDLKESELLRADLLDDPLISDGEGG